MLLSLLYKVSPERKCQVFSDSNSNYRGKGRVSATSHCSDTHFVQRLLSVPIGNLDTFTSCIQMLCNLASCKNSSRNSDEIFRSLIDGKWNSTLQWGPLFDVVEYCTNNSFDESGESQLLSVLSL